LKRESRILKVNKFKVLMLDFPIIVLDLLSKDDFNGFNKHKRQEEIWI